MREYPKTENVFTRNPETHKLNVGDLRLSEFELISRWLVTEKIDGTNIRVLLRLDEDDNLHIDVRGRTDRANTPKDLEEAVYETVIGNEAGARSLLWHLSGGRKDITVCLYGEGYGAGIQKIGRSYRPDKSLRLFDVTTTLADGPRWWRSWETVTLAADLTGFATVPAYGYLDLDDIVNLVESEPLSEVAREENDCDTPAEGIVARTDPYLYTHDHKRVMFKLKTHDIT